MIQGQENHGSAPVFHPRKREKKKENFPIILVDPILLHNLQIAVTSSARHNI
jgi:hypothetical protein